MKNSKLPAILLLTLGAAFLVIGISRGEAETVFTKAVHICLECIGIG
ncbi:MAG: CD1871A family CXXC motif-containing protein [Eubacteriaceae bacterium]|nr:CD1871A family CXXC motif-containing protein [Eubacteriaceae bacterium]